MNIPIYLKPLAEEAKKYNSANEFIEALKQTIHKEECGCIWSKWIRLPGLPCMCRGGNDTPDEEVIQNAIGNYKIRYKKEKVEVGLRSKYPNKQLYEGSLPEDDVTFEGKPGIYIYILKDRKRHKKYQVQEAISVEFKCDRPLNLEEFWKGLNKKGRTSK